MVIKGKAQDWPFPDPKVCSVGLMSRGFRGISSHCALRYSTLLLTTAPLHLRGTLFLEFPDGLLAEKDEQLPFTWHVVRTLQQFHFVEDVVLIVFMWAQEVIIGDPEGKVIVGTVDVVEPVCMAVRSFIGAVQPFDHLLERAVFPGNNIVVGKSNHLCDLKSKIFPELLCEFHCGEGIGTVTIGDELEFFRQLCKTPEGHPHGKDTGADATVVRYLVTDDGTGSSVHNEPDIGFDAADLDIGFVSGEHRILLVRVLVNKGLDADGRGLAVVGDLLVGDADVVEVFQCLGGFAQGEAKIDMECQAQGHDMGIMLTEFQGRCVLWQGV